MSTDLSELTCPDCGARDQREAFCDSCGAALSRPRPAAVGAGKAAAFEDSPAAGAALPDLIAELAVAAESASDSASDSAAESAVEPAAESKPGAIPKQATDSRRDARRESTRDSRRDAQRESKRGSEAGTGNGSGLGTGAGAVAASGLEPEPAFEESDTLPLAEPARAEPAQAEAARAEAARTEAERAERERVAAERARQAERARALLVPVADPTARDRIAPVLPGVPDPITPQRKNAEGLEVLDAGIECQWCATRNPPERHFCRKCGQRLAYAPVEAKRPSWWRRLIFFWRNRPLPFAGQRPRLRRGPGQAIRPVVWAVVLVVVVVVVVKEYSPVSTDVRDHFAKPNEVSNWTVTASHQDPNHQAKLLHDTYSDTWWGSGFSPQNTNGASVTVTFSQPENLLDVGITPGAGTATDTFGAQGSPETVDVELIPIPGKGAPIKKTFTLDDQPGFQKFQLRGDDIRQVVFTITSSYPPTAADPAKAVETALTELEFYTRH